VIDNIDGQKLQVQKEMELLTAQMNMKTSENQFNSIKALNYV